jgi:cyclase
VSLSYFGPGHTSGDAVIFFQRADVVHGGDLLFRRLHPRVDGPAGASVVNWQKILEKLAAEHGTDTAFVFGHGKDGVVVGKKAYSSTSAIIWRRRSITSAPV